jgi:hypothetical protein
MKRLLKALWKQTWPLRAQVDAKIDKLVYAATGRALEAHDPTQALADDVTLVLDAVLAEQFRLQSQIEELEHLVREALAARDGAAV